MNFNAKLEMPVPAYVDISPDEHQWTDFMKAAPKGQYMPYPTHADCEEDCEINDRHALIQMERFRVFCVFKRMTK